MSTLPTSDRLRALLELVEESLAEPGLSGDELAARAYLSRFHFDRLMRAAVGEPPGTFRRRLLLERAAHRLASGTDAVIDVASAAGYGSPEAFARAFARAFGCPPSTFRGRGGTAYQLAAPSGVHFHPPGGLRLPAMRRSEPMDVLTTMLEHHLSLTEQILERTGGLSQQSLDASILTVAGIDSPQTLRTTAERLVSQLEMWIAALEGNTAVTARTEYGTLDLRRRLAAAAPRFRELVLAPILEGRGSDTFIDATCDPPQTFSYGGVLAHVLTFSAARRTMAVGALETAGVADLGSGDPMHFVGGSGDDAATISRSRR